MHTLKKITSLLILLTFVCSSANVSAATNKESVLSSIDTLRASITKSVNEKEKDLSDRATTLGNKYDESLRAKGYSIDEVDALTRIPTLSAPNFRRDISDAYADTKSKSFGDIRTVDTELQSMREEISLGYSDLSNAQKSAYDTRLQSYSTRYNAFLTGSTSLVESFTATLSGKLSSSVDSVVSMMQKNGEYIRFVASVRSTFADLDSAKAAFLSTQNTLDTVTLPKLQGEITALAADKKMATNLVRTNLTEWLEKAITAQDRLAKQSTDLRAYLETIMTRWNEYLANNFAEDDTFVGQSLEAKNLLASDTNLRARVYDASGDIRTLDPIKDADIITLAKKLRDDYAKLTKTTSDLNTQYSTGSKLSNIRTSFRSAQEAKIREYQSDFETFLQNRLNTALLTEQNHAQNLALMDSEEKLLQNQLQSVTSADYAKTLSDEFSKKLAELSKKDSASDTVKKAQNLSYKYARLALQRKIEETTSFASFYSSRTKLDEKMSAFIEDYADRQSGGDTARSRLAAVADKINSLVATGKISAKKQYQLLVLRANILKYLENATK